MSDVLRSSLTADELSFRTTSTRLASPALEPIEEPELASNLTVADGFAISAHHTLSPSFSPRTALSSLQLAPTAESTRSEGRTEADREVEKGRSTLGDVFPW